MNYESILMNTQERLLIKRNQFNNCIDSDSLEIIIKEIAVLEDKQNYCIKKIKEERKELQAI